MRNDSVKVAGLASSAALEGGSVTAFRFMRSTKGLLSFAAILAVTCVLTSQASASPPPQAATAPGTPQNAPQLEPKAIEVLKAACAKLAAAHSMSFTALVTYESPSRLGFPLAYGTKSDVLFQRPNKLRVLTPGDGPASEFYYDGKTMMAFSPAENLVAVADAPPTVDEMLETAYHSAAIYYPFDDLIVSDPYKDIAQDLRIAFYIGQSKIVGGTTTDVVAYDTGGVFIQAWIGAEDKLPRVLRAIYVDDPLQIRHNLVITNWQLDPAIPADSFSTNKASDAKHIPFASPNLPPGMAKPASAAQTTNP
jgi:hypothetical protein